MQLPRRMSSLCVLQNNAHDHCLASPWDRSAQNQNPWGFGFDVCSIFGNKTARNITLVSRKKCNERLLEYILVCQYEMHHRSCFRHEQVVVYLDQIQKDPLPRHGSGNRVVAFLPILSSRTKAVLSCSAKPVSWHVVLAKLGLDPSWYHWGPGICFLKASIDPKHTCWFETPR